MRTEKFSYATDDFKPCIRKNPHRKRNFTIAGVLVLLLLVVLGAGFYKSFIYREKLESDEAVSRAFTDIKDHYGKNSYVVQALGAEQWFDIIEDGTIGIDQTIKLKELGDFGLGIENLASGVNLETEAVFDTSEKKAKGSVTAGWTLFDVELLDFYGDEEKITFSSSEFFDETLVLNKSELTFWNRPISELYDQLLDGGLSSLLYNVYPEGYENNYGQSEIAKSEYGTMSLKELAKLSDFTVTVFSLPEEKTFVVDGSEEKCYGYKIEAVNELLSTPVTVTIYVDRKYRLVNLNLDYIHELDDGCMSGVSLTIDFTGSEHPADTIIGNLKLFAGDDEITGSFEIRTKNEDDKVTVAIDGMLTVPGINLFADIDFEFDRETGDISINSSMTDEADVLEIASGGSIENNTDDGSLVISLNKLRVTYSDKLIVLLNTRLEITDKSQQNISIEAQTAEPDKVVDVLKMTDDEYQRIVNQLEERYSYYYELFKQLMSY
jgi:hypothetical protein